MIVSELYDFVHDGELEKVSQWLTARPEDLNVGIGDGYTPLHVACLFGQSDLTRWLLARGALVNVNAANASRATALHLAVAYREEDVAEVIVQMLIENGAELNALQTGGETALHHAVARASYTLVKHLVEAGADPFLKDERGRTSAELAKTLEESEEGDDATEQRASLREIREILRSAVRN